MKPRTGITLLLTTLIALPALSGVLLLGILHEVFVDFGSDRHTPYCPPAHLSNDLATCSILDQQGDRIFIQHGDLDNNVYYWEIRSPAGSRYYPIPDDITQLAPEGYTAQLIEGDSEHVIYRGKRYKLGTRIGTPKW